MRSGRPPGRCQTGRDCTAPTSPPGPRYTPDELGLEDADADKAPDAPPPSGREAGETPEGVEGDSGPGAHADLTEAALEGGYSAATVVELCRFYYDQPTLAELGDHQAVDMAGRLGLARVQGVDDERLARPWRPGARPCPTAAGRGRRPTSGSCSAPPTAVRRHGRRNPSAR